ncbi:MAG: HAD family phosphatase [Acidisphaera sp.]|nr:HAD family phosphatase [Acidisphaera sp.]
MTKISLLLADVDGTLVTRDKVLTERARQAVLAARRRGIRFAITSGRPPRGMSMLFDPLDIDTPIAGFNGGMMVRRDLSILEARTLPKEIAQQAIEIIDTHGMDFWVYAGNDWYVRDRRAPHVDREAWTVKFEPIGVPDMQDKLEEAVKIVGISDDHDLVAKCEAAAQQAFGDRATASRSQPYYLDVTHREANKGGVVAYLSKHLNIPPEEIATIGDQPNDVLMFIPSGYSVAMGNASDAVKQRATATTDDSENEGFAKAVEAMLEKFP